MCLFIVLACADSIFDFRQIYADYMAKKQEEEANEFAEMLKQHYKNKNDEFEKENASLTGVDVVFIGDSLTEGYNLPEFYNEFTFANRGIGGDTTFGVEDRLKVSAYDVNPRVLVLMIGTNNLESMLENYESILLKLKDNLPETNVIVMSVPPTGEALIDRNPQIALNNVTLKILAEKHGCTYVDIFTLLYNCETGALRAEYTYDDLHFTKEGYDIITDALKPILLYMLGIN